MNQGRAYLKGFFAAFCLFAQAASAVVSFQNNYRSPRNKERPLRKSTSLIILHTTEAPSSSALQKLSSLGECHYCVAENGKVYRIIDRTRVAFHAGRSMWNGRSNVDDFSIGIEVCGYHNKTLTQAQYRSLSELIGELQYIYKIPDHSVISHSHVAYGTPNKWFKRSHRGRKRCGMQFALPAVRRALNLATRPGSDPDVKAKRLVVGDAYLSRVLYGNVAMRQRPVPAITAAKPAQPPAPAAEPAKAAAKKRDAPARKRRAAPPPTPEEAVGQLVAESPDVDENVIGPKRSAWDIARAAYNAESTVYVFPDGSRRRGHQIIDFKAIPTGTRVNVHATDENLPDTYQTIGVNGDARDIAGDEALSFKTVYVYPDGHYFRGSQLNAASVLKLPYSTKVLLGYSVGGPVTAKCAPSAVCGARWRAKDTFYLINGALVPGDKVDDAKIPSGTMVFFKS